MHPDAVMYGSLLTTFLSTKVCYDIAKIQFDTQGIPPDISIILDKDMAKERLENFINNHVDHSRYNHDFY